MATTTITLTVDRQARDVLRAHLSYGLPFEEMDGAVDAHDEELGLELKARAAFVFSMLDDLGWAERGDREHYEISVAPEEFRAWLSVRKTDAEEQLTGDRSGLEHVEAGDDGWCFLGHSREVSIEMSKQLVAEGAHAVEMLARVLDDLSGAAVA